MRQRDWIYSLGALGLYFLLLGLRLGFENQAGVWVGGVRGAYVGSRFDPRNLDNVDRSARQRESEFFKERIASRGRHELGWPGVKAAQVSLAWLEVLQGVHDDQSYEGDFSWVFSKLDFIFRSTPREEKSLLIALAPFYFLMNRDGAGSSFLMNSMIARAPDEWKVWFWSGFHALENLKDRDLAGDLYRQAAVFPGSPFYLGALSYRLSNPEIFSRLPRPEKIIREDLPPAYLEKIRRARPEWIAE